MRPNYFTLLFALLGVVNTEAQFVISDTLNATQLAVGIFQGVGVTISNATVDGSTALPNRSFGGYTSSGVSIIPESGVILSTGIVSAIADSAFAFQSENLSSGVYDPDLEEIIDEVVQDVTVLNFDFVPDADLLLFDYVFGSEEYPEFVCSYNDVFGFFLSGPGIAGPYLNNAVNIALLPDMITPVAINNVNNGFNNVPDDPNCPAMNPQYYYDNTNGSDVIYDGMTTILQASAIVIPDQTYHVKLAIGNAIDSFYDSGLFLKQQSFRSIPSITLGLSETATNTIQFSIDQQGRLQMFGAGSLTAIQLLDAQGRLIQSEGRRTLPSSMEIAELPNGVYFLNALHNGSPYRTKLMKY